MAYKHWLISATLPALVFTTLATEALADAYPNRPIRLIASVGPGGPVDLMARILGQKLGAAMGQPVVVENKPGAGGNLAASLVAKTPADGYTLMIATTSFVTNVTLYGSKLDFDPLKDFAPISQLASTFVVLAVPSASNAKSVKELIESAQASKQKINYASAGTGEANHVAMELLKVRAGFDAVHVPYKTMADAANGLVGEQVDAAMLGISVSLSQAKAGKLRILATTAPKRSPLAPDVPTVAESVSGYELTTWWGLVAPAGTPKEVVDRIYRETAKALAQPDVIAQMAALGAEPAASSPQDFTKLLHSEVGRWGQLIKLSGAKVE